MSDQNTANAVSPVRNAPQSGTKGLTDRIDFDSVFDEVDRMLDSGEVVVDTDAASSVRSTRSAVKRVAPQRPTRRQGGEPEPEPDDQAVPGDDDLDAVADDDLDAVADDDLDAADDGGGAGEPGPDGSGGVSDLTDEELEVLEAVGASPAKVLQLSRLSPEQRAPVIELLREQAQEQRRSAAAGGGNGPANYARRQFNPEQIQALLGELPSGLVDKFAEASGLPAEAVKDLAAGLRASTAEPLLGVIGELLSLVQAQQAHFERAHRNFVIRTHRAALARQYPELKDDKAFRRLVSSRAFEKAVEGYREDGLDVAEATERALRDRAAAAYGQNARNRAALDLSMRRNRSLKSTAEPGSGARRSATPSRNLTFEEKLEAGFDKLKALSRRG